MCMATPEGYFKIVNPALSEILGFSEKELLAIPFTEFIHPEDRAATLTEVERLAGGEPSVDFENRYRCKDGTYLWFSWRVKVRDNLCFCVARDITEQKRAQDELHGINLGLERIVRQRTSDLKWAAQALQQSETLFEAILDQMPDMIYLLDDRSTPAGKILRVNRTVIDVYGYTFDELMGLPFNELSADTRRDTIFHSDTRIDRREILRIEEEHRRKDGGRFPVEILVREIDYGPGRVVLAIARDITGRRAEEEGRRLLDARMQQSQKLESLGILAGGIAHDFNNLLTGVLGNAELARRKLPERSPISSNLERIEQAADRAAGLCQQMLAYSGHGALTSEPLDLRFLVTDILELIQSSISKKAELSLEFDDDVPWVLADTNQLRQVVMNLITNASDALGDLSGKIEIRIRNEVRTVPFQADVPGDIMHGAGTYVCLEVVDSGCGMDDETRQRIFDPFFTTKFTGRGLGMAAVMGIIRGHHGAMEVESALGVGTQFRLLLPVQDVGAAASPQRSRAHHFIDTHHSGSMEPQLILVADDEELVRQTAREALESAGFRVLMAEDGLRAVEVFRAHATAIDAVLLDVTMPGLTGYEVSEILSREAPGVGLVMMSGYSEQDCTLPRANGFVHKPFNRHEIVSKILEAAIPNQG